MHLLTRDRVGVWRPLIAVAAWSLLFAGCDMLRRFGGEEKKPDTPKSSPAPPKVVVQPVKTGSFELSLSPPVKTGECHARLLRLSEGRPTILQLTSYRSSNLETFPSFMLRAEVSAEAMESLEGQTVQAQLFVQDRQGGPVWNTRRGSPVDVNIISSSAKSVTGEIVGGVLVNAETGERVDARGKFEGMVQGS